MVPSTVGPGCMAGSCSHARARACMLGGGWRPAKEGPHPDMACLPAAQVMAAPAHPHGHACTVVVGVRGPTACGVHLTHPVPRGSAVPCTAMAACLRVLAGGRHTKAQTQMLSVCSAIPDLSSRYSPYSFLHVLLTSAECTQPTEESPNFLSKKTEVSPQQLIGGLGHWAHNTNCNAKAFQAAATKGPEAWPGRMQPTDVYRCGQGS